MNKAVVIYKIGSIFRIFVYKKFVQGNMDGKVMLPMRADETFELIDPEQLTVFIQKAFKEGEEEI